MLFADSHFHLTEEFCAKPENEPTFAGTINVSSIQELEKAEKIKSAFAPQRIALAFGSFSFFDRLEDSEAVLSFGRSTLDSLETVLQRTSKAFDAVGEAVLDAASQERRKTLNAQTEIFSRQLKLAEKYGKCLVIHCVRAMPLIFEFAPMLKKLPAVVFHGWSGSVNEAGSLLKRGINCFFSIGTPLINGKKSAAACAAALPLERILFETDFPYCNVKGVRLSQLETIKNVYSFAAAKRSVSMEDLAVQVYCNFSRAFFNSAINSL